MADALTVLRQYNVEKRDIVQRDGQVIFGDFAWPSNTKTNYLIFGTGKNGIAKDYYSLDCILFLLNNVALPHALYVRQAAAANVQVVRRPSRKDLLSYLNGKTSTSSNIDKSAPLEISLQRPIQVKRTADDASLEHEKKKPRLEEAQVQRDKERLSKKLDTPKEGSMIPEQIKAVMEFVQNEGQGRLPVDGSIPDTKADSERYIQQQNIYKEQAQQDIAVVTNYVHQLLQTLGRFVMSTCPKHDVSVAAVELHSVAAYMGGVAAQEVIKVINHPFIPVNNTYIYNAMKQSSVTVQM
ncbi:Parafibromin [Lamellibrachia satsuma]|nr:Parafibromin [Lamellibrachia satsuma]